MAIDYFLRSTGVSGESLDAKHKGEIDVESWSMARAHSSCTRGRGAGPALGKCRYRT